MAEIQIQIVNSYRHREKVGKYPHGVVFTESEIKGRVQLFRYGISALISFVTSYAILRLLIEVFGVYASISNVIASVIVAIISYLIQRNFTFR
jgi:hypothetical protein